jgi:hypothetical protein
MRTPKPASELRPGDLVDLEGDPFADPDRANVSLASEFQRVATVDRETPNCVAVGFEGFDAVGFPAGHHVRVVDCQTLAIAAPRAMTRTQLDLASSLACYTSDEDWGEDRAAFLREVSARIALDLASGEF